MSSARPELTEEERLGLIIAAGNQTFKMAAPGSTEKINARRELENLLKQEKSKIFLALKTIKPIEQQLELLQVCAYGTETPPHPLTKRFWKPSNPFGSCDLNSGTLKEVVIEIERLKNEIKIQEKPPVSIHVSSQSASKSSVEEKKEIEEKKEVLDASFWTNAQECYKNKDYTNAILSCDKVIQSNPSFKDAYDLRGQCYHRLNNLEEAISNYVRFIELENLSPAPNKKTIYAATYNLGQAYCGAKEFDQAIVSFTDAINQSNKQGVVPLLARADAYAQSGRLALAIYDYCEAYKLAPVMQGKKHEVFKELTKFLDGKDQKTVFDALMTMRPLEAQLELLKICREAPTHPLGKKFLTQPDDMLEKMDFRIRDLEMRVKKPSPQAGGGLSKSSYEETPAAPRRPNRH